MLNIGMTELLCFAIIALLILGPDKLPEGARFAAKWYGKIKKFIGNVQNEIDRELRLSEFREEMQKEIDKITELERRMQQQLDAIRSTDDNNTSKDQPTKEQQINSYQCLERSDFTPFSKGYIQRHWKKLLTPLETRTAPIQLKIAV